MKTLKFLPVLLVVMTLALFLRLGDLAERLVIAFKGSTISFNMAFADSKEAEKKTDDKKAADKSADKPADAKADAKSDTKSDAKAKDDKVAAPDETVDEKSAAEEKDIAEDDATRPASEVTLLQQLNGQRQKLNAREAEMDSREGLLKATEGQLQQKTEELTKLKTEIESLVKQAENKQEKQMDSLVKIYETMKPKDAANIFNTLDTNVLLGLTGRMKEGKLAPVLAAMNPDRARQVTTELAGRAQKIPKTDALDNAVPAMPAAAPAKPQ